MARTRGELSEAEVARLVSGFERSELTRREYCAEVGIAVTTLDYYRRRQGRSRSLVPVEMVESSGRSAGFTLVLGNGRRIEGDWNFHSDTLARLVRVAEQA